MSNSSKNLRRRQWYLKTLQRVGSYLRARYRALTWGCTVGAWGERVAARHLTSRGLVMLKRNWRHSRLEADCIAYEDRTIVVVEVKTRHETLRERYPAKAAVTPEKRRRLEHLGRSFVRNNGPFFRRFAIKSIRIETYEVYYQSTAFGLPRVSTIIVHRT